MKRRILRLPLQLGLLAVTVVTPWTLNHAASLAEYGTLSGKVTAPKPFRGAQVYIRNVDKHVLYMVYTSGGRYQAVDLLPGSYEVSVREKGFSSDVKKLTVKSGSLLNADFALEEGSL